MDRRSFITALVTMVGCGSGGDSQQEAPRPPSPPQPPQPEPPPPPTPPTPTPGESWTRLDPGTQPAARINSFFNRPCILQSGDIVALWDAAEEADQSGLRVFSRSTNTWRVYKQSEIGSMPADWPGYPGPLFGYRWENNFADYSDSLGKCFWSTTAPQNFQNADDIQLDMGVTPPVFTTFPHGLGTGDDCGGCWNGNAYSFGFANGSFDQIKYRALPNGAVRVYRDAIVPPMGDNNIAWASGGMVRGGIDHHNGRAWIFTGEQTPQLWTRDLTGDPDDGKGWVKVLTSGIAPQYGFAATLVEDQNCIVCYTGSSTGGGGTENNPWTGSPPTDQQTIYVLPLDTLTWRYGPRPPDAVPPAAGQTGMALLYDRFNKETKLVLGFGLGVWQLTIAGAPAMPPATLSDMTGPTAVPAIVIDGGGKWISIPLPRRLAGGKATAPWCVDGSAKHVACAFNESDGRLYANGGDVSSDVSDSYQQRTFSMALMVPASSPPRLASDAGSWKGEYPYTGVGYQPTHPDMTGLYRDAAKKRLILAPGLLIGSVQEYSAFRDDTKTWAQLTFPPGWHSSGCIWGGVFDPVTRNEISFYISNQGTAAQYRNMDTFDSRLVVWPSTYVNYPDSSIGQARTAIDVVGRHVYVCFNGGPQYTTPVARMMRWHIDKETLELLPDPPVNSAHNYFSSEQNLLGFYGGKVVLPFVESTPQVDRSAFIIKQLLVLDVSSLRWSEDSTRPSVGNFVGNSICSTPLGVVMVGDAYGPGHTHLFIYRP